eukprot:5421606-Pleurochrysis_carterae.AAC.2
MPHKDARTKQTKDRIDMSQGMRMTKGECTRVLVYQMYSCECACMWGVVPSRTAQVGGHTIGCSHPDHNPRAPATAPDTGVAGTKKTRFNGVGPRVDKVKGALMHAR